jgi:hypothetical protein
MIEHAERRRHVHPFPARMAPEVALQKIELLTQPGDTVLDPMCGSGTVVRAASERGRKGIGTDLDPLAVIITSATCTPSWSLDLASRAEEVLRRAKQKRPSLPVWIARDEETRSFVNYWFAPDQIDDLARISKVLVELPRRDNTLRVALSRLIVTKESGASLARDTAHSRPHRVRDDNDFDVFQSYRASAVRLETMAPLASNWTRSSVQRGDARSLGSVTRGSVDLVVTSPPYLNAIDYLRGHRMSLVWMGWTVGELRQLRRETIGAERSLAKDDHLMTTLAGHAVPRLDDLSSNQRSMVIRFMRDIDRMCRTLGRVVKKRGHAVLVVADSQLKGVPIENAAICTVAGQRHGLEVVDRQIRLLPAHHRYLPPPTAASGKLSRRMKEEVILTLCNVGSNGEPSQAR